MRRFIQVAIFTGFATFVLAFSHVAVAGAGAIEAMSAGSGAVSFAVVPSVNSQPTDLIGNTGQVKGEKGEEAELCGDPNTIMIC